MTLHIAQKIVSLIDLTSLNQEDTNEKIEALCAKSQTPIGRTAAICIYPPFIKAATTKLSALGLLGQVKIATVANFPEGGIDAHKAAKATEEAVSFGADEVDIVLPWRALKAGEKASAISLVRACKKACGGKTLKVIIESGELKEAHLIELASQIAIAEGANFIKTSTGKVPVNATPEAARLMLNVIAKNNPECGFKAAGGVRTLGEAVTYLALAEEIMGKSWVNASHFRFGASGLLDQVLSGSAPQSGY